MAKLSLEKSVVDPESHEDYDTIIARLYEKINKSAALNGGFDRMFVKIDSLEKGQEKIVEKVDKIHDAMYNPSEGLFAKIAEHKLENEVKLSNINQSMLSLNNWKDFHEKEVEIEKTGAVKIGDRMNELEKIVDTLDKNRKNIWAAAKWFLVALGGALSTIFIKLIENSLK